MTQTVAPPRAAAHLQEPCDPRSVAVRLWFWCSLAAIAVAHLLKFPALHAYVLANVDQAPRLDELPPEMLDAALTAGTSMGVALSLILSLVALVIVRRAGLRARAQRPAPLPVFPFWLSGVAVVGLVLPDLITAATGVIHPWVTPVFQFAYPAAVAAAILLAPGPERARFRLVDVAVAGFLPFV